MTSVAIAQKALWQQMPLSEQYEVVSRCAQLGLDLDSELERIGSSYEDLRYLADVENSIPKIRARTLREVSTSYHDVPVVSFFAGCGGLDLGFEAAGFAHALSVEINETFCETIRTNRPKWTVIGPPSHVGDISDRGQVVVDVTESGIGEGFEGVFVGGPPCQPFSIAANQRFSKAGDNFKRTGFAHETQGNLLLDYVALIKYFRPKAFLIENVPGIIDIDEGAQVARVLSTLRRAGYTVEDPLQVNAANYLVPQIRHRVFIVGFLGTKRFVAPALSTELIPCSAALAGIPKNARNHETRSHKADSVIRYMQLGYGERDQLGRVDRLDPRLPSKTVIAGGTKGGGRSHLHPFIPRTLSVRECARLQTFPDDYVFEGPTARQFTQVGNAVPPVLGAQLATAIFNSFFK
jgi:DNA (cytosine-5)-methyltransferase 1